MKTRSSLRTLVAASALFLSVGSLSHLAAQSATTSSVAGQAKAEKPVTRTYTGTVTQTSAAGVATTGTITINFHAGAKLDATTLIDGVTTIYHGELLASDTLLQATTGGYHTPKTVGSFNQSVVVDAPGIVVATGQIPVIVDKAVAYGGQQNEDGSALTFRAARDAK